MVLALALLSGCDTGGALGDACGLCKQGLACAGDLPGGLCIADCSSEACPDGAICLPVAGNSWCLKSCTDASRCRQGYQCFQGACQPACASDGECGQGFACMSGACTALPGAKEGAPCGADGDCSSRMCLDGTCALPCTHDQVCPSTETCAFHPQGTALRPACAPRRGTAAPGAACSSDGDCDRGECQLGVCVELCGTTPDCGQGMTCAKMVFITQAQDLLPFTGCLPQTGTLDFDDEDGIFALPSNAQSFAIYTRLQAFDFSNFVGVTRLADPSGKVIYTPPMTQADFFTLPIRYTPTESSSTMLVPNSPAITLQPGAYQFDVNTSKLGTQTRSRIYIKLGDAPIAGGKVSLNFYVTDLSQASCAQGRIGAADVKSALASQIAEIKQIFSQAGITVDEVTAQASSAPPVVRVSTDPNAQVPDLDNVLQAATSNASTRPGLDVVLVRAITDPNGNQNGVLGVAGGIPGSPLLATPHSGAVVSIQNLCFGQPLGIVAAHETAHTLGLFHSVEQAGQHDPLTDTAGDGTSNLMYWAENSGRHLSMQQGQVLRNDPKVRP